MFNIYCTCIAIWNFILYEFNLQTIQQSAVQFRLGENLSQSTKDEF
jgi:hypothetical protein